MRFLRSQPIWRFGVVIALAGLSSWLVYTLDIQRQHGLFSVQVEKQRHVLSKAFSHIYQLQLSAQLFLQQEAGPSQAAFHRFIDTHTRDNAGIDSVMWLPRVNRAELSDVFAQRHPVQPYPPLSRKACQWVMRNDTFPALYVSPKAKENGYLGWRADAQCDNTVTMERAYFKRQPEAMLISDQHGYGVRWFAAITEPDGQLRGYLATTLYFNSFFPALWQGDTPSPAIAMTAKEAFGHQQLFSTHSLAQLRIWQNQRADTDLIAIPGSEEGLVVQFFDIQSRSTASRYAILVGILVLALGLSILASFWSYANRLTLAQTLVTNQTRQLYHQARHDSLTGLSNRAALDSMLERMLAMLKAQRATSFTLLFIDLDRFKAVNDSLGHVVGDTLLRRVASRLSRYIPDERIFRFGGDEFIVLLEQDCALALAQTKAKQLLRALSQPYSVDEHVLNISASIGIATVNNANASLLDIIQQADIAMYHAKLTRERLAIFQPAMLAKVQHRFIVEQDLKKALVEHQFTLAYQPIFDGKNETLSHAEALLRWYHPTLGTISPAEFIPIAEETGYIIELGEWVLEQVALKLDNWSERLPTDQCPTITVNVSAKQCQASSFADDIADLLTRHRFAPQCLALEMTETALLEHSECVATNLHRLHQLGVKLYLDDFGTGYSSLSLLRQYPFSVVKMDRSFIMDIDQLTGKAAPLCRGIIAMAHALDLRVVAEGVETRQQLAWLSAHQCDYLQGYVLSRPLESHAIDKQVMPASYQRMMLVHG